MRTLRFLTTLLLAGIFASACSPAPSQAPTQAVDTGKLTPYSTVTQTPTITPTPKNAPTATPSPTPSPTPVIYVVKEKDTLGVIAWRNGITVDELKAANPTVDPYMMPVGTKLIIPQAHQGTQTPSPLEATSVPVQVASTECTPAASGGLYCFAQVNNPQENALSNFAAEFQLTDTQTGTTAAQQALLPAAELAAGASLDLYAYFPPPTAAQYTVTLNVLSASNAESTPAAAGIQLGEPEIVISQDGYSASINGNGVYTEAAEGAKTLTITAVSYDEQGKANGVRRLELSIDTSTSSEVPFSLTVYSIQGAISKVALFAETRP